MNYISPALSDSSEVLGLIQIMLSIRKNYFWLQKQHYILTGYAGKLFQPQRLQWKCRLDLNSLHKSGTGLLCCAGWWMGICSHAALATINTFWFSLLCSSFSRYIGFTSNGEKENVCYTDIFPAPWFFLQIETGPEPECFHLTECSELNVACFLSSLNQPWARSICWSS